MAFSASTSKLRSRATISSSALGPHTEETEAFSEGDPSVRSATVFRLFENALSLRKRDGMRLSYFPSWFDTVSRTPWFSLEHGINA